ncbi:hydroxymethylpyrimidine/phosphomethylpyrimidine kinase [Formosa sp. S-31]|uniref:hydroxymethylpyrimidine/phosphomethylpyrimidine kinase n=1 Tax=Formosa sp. S-31 TaxID=2790949 RepID=UPI003EBE84B4
MEQSKLFVLSIAGFDPSSGAGITSDIKTFEANGVYGLSVCTAVTVQNDINLEQCFWLPQDLIQDQITTLFGRFKIEVVKIGIIESWEFLQQLVRLLKRLNPDIKIVLDTVLKASSGFDFHKKSNIPVILEVFKVCFCITPNYDEIKTFYPEKCVHEIAETLSENTIVFIKGGHRKDKRGWDDMYVKGALQKSFTPGHLKVYDKHGSGCVLSAALASNLAKRLPLETAYKQAKEYTESFLNSSLTLLGVHNYKENDK